MCLIATSRVKTASKDIECFKILRLRGRSRSSSYDRDWQITSPYQQAHSIESAMVSTHKPFKGKGFRLLFNFVGRPEVEIGLHSFVSLNDAVDAARSKSSMVFVVNATIPKGAKYVKGYHRTKGGWSRGDNTDYPHIRHYASDALQLGEIAHISGNMSDNYRADLHDTYAAVTGRKVTQKVTAQFLKD